MNTTIYNLDFEDKWFVACSHTDGVLNKINQIRLQTEKEVPYVNTGVLLMNLKKLRKNLNLNDICFRFFSHLFYKMKKHLHLY